QRGYTSRWDKARAAYLAKHPWCRMCLANDGERVRATVVDHIKPHRQDMRLFWDKSNWQSLCEPHHNSTKQRDERRGYVTGCDVHGNPLDPNRHWAKETPVPPAPLSDFRKG